MKDCFVFICRILIIIYCYHINFTSNAQSIIAGQTTGDHVFYFDIDDVILYAEPNNPVTFHMNIDGGWFDLQFRAYLFYGTFSTEKGSEVTPLGNTCISIILNKDNWIEKNELNDTIDLSSNWYSNLGILESYYEDDFGNSIVSGVFDGEGYMGFKIDSPDFIIGWIRLDVFWSEITIYDFAFYSDTYVTDPEFNMSDYRIVFQNPVTDNLVIYLNSSYDCSFLNYRIFDLLGHIFENGVLSSGQNLIDLHNLSSGVLVLQVLNNNGSSKSYLIFKH